MSLTKSSSQYLLVPDRDTSLKAAYPPRSRSQDTIEKVSSSNQYISQLERTTSFAESLDQQSFVSGGSWGTPSSCEGPTVIKNDIDDLNGEEPIIAIMGPQGAGKSTFMNIVTGSDVAQIGEDLASCTHGIQVVRCHNPLRNCEVLFVDTPGFVDTYRSDKDILEELAEWLEKTYRQGIQLSGILFLHRITDNRMSNTLLRNLDQFRKLCGDDTLSNIRLVTTHWDLLPTMKEGERIEKELCEEYWAPFIASGARVHRFQNSPASAWEIVTSLPMERESVQTQKESIDQGLPLLLTPKGQTQSENHQKSLRRPPWRSLRLYHRRPLPDPVYSSNATIPTSRARPESSPKWRLPYLRKSERQATADPHFESVKHTSTFDSQYNTCDIPGVLPLTLVPSRAGTVATSATIILCYDDTS